MNCLSFIFVGNAVNGMLYIVYIYMCLPESKRSNKKKQQKNNKISVSMFSRHESSSAANR